MGRISLLGSTELATKTFGRVMSWGVIGGRAAPSSRHFKRLPPRSQWCLGLLGGTISLLRVGRPAPELGMDSVTAGAGSAGVDDNSGSVPLAGRTCRMSSPTVDERADDGGLLSHRLAH